MSMHKEYIIDNISELSVDQLIGSIQDGIVTLDELINESDGNLSPDKRRLINDYLINGDENAWNAVVINPTRENIQDYLNNFSTGKYRNQARELIGKIDLQFQQEQEELRVNELWNSIDKGDVNALREYVSKHPNSEFVTEASRLINEIQIDQIIGIDIESIFTQIEQLQAQADSIINGMLFTQQDSDDETINIISNSIDSKKISKDIFVKKLKEEPNSLSVGIINKLIDKTIITVGDLLNVGIDERFVKKLRQPQDALSFDTPPRLKKIHKQSTEVYFWGIPSSGKSTALGAIISAAANGSIARSMDADIGSQGYGYMTKLMNLFQPDKITTLIAGTAVDEFYEMGFDLVDYDGNVHPITCIDMAGELMRCMYKHNAKENLSVLDLEMLDTLTRILIDNSSSSRKMHVFVIEYGAENRLYEGLPQRTYLDGALSYIKNTGIFEKDTDAIYILISKSDKIKERTIQSINEYVMDKYKGFYNGLTQICEDNYINKGKVEKIAFTLGQVCFQNYCIYDPKAAENVVRILLERSASYKRGKKAKIFGALRK